MYLCPLNDGPPYTMGLGDPQTGRTISSSIEVQLPTLNSYGYNAWGVGYLNWNSLGPGGMTLGAKPPLTLTATLDSLARAPADMLAFGDIFLRSKNGLWDGSRSFGSVIGPSVTLGEGNYPTKTPPKKQPNFIKHNRIANRAFVDGHVESEDMRKLFKPTDAQLSRWNVDP